MRARILGALTLLLLLSACAPSGAKPGPTTLRLGFFPNLTHAPAIVGLEEGLFEKSLGSQVALQTRTFNAGPAAVEALFSDAIDIVYVGPNPALNAYTRSGGNAIRIIAGAASGGASFVVQPDIASANDLRGKKVSSPQIGNTQDIALRSWLTSKGLETTKEGGGDVNIQPQENAQILETFRSKQIAGAWVPEPWATRLQLEGGGKVLVNEKDLWPGGKYVTTLVVVRTKFLREHPDVVRGFLRGHIAAIDRVDKGADAAKKAANAGIEKITGKALETDVLERAWTNVDFTLDPIASSLTKVAASAEKFGFLESSDLRGIYHLGPLNALLRAADKPTI